MWDQYWADHWLPFYWLEYDPPSGGLTVSLYSEDRTTVNLTSGQ